MIVVDASVVVKWFKPDEKSPQADFFLEEHLAGRTMIAVPTLMLYEVANALWASRRLRREEIEQALCLIADAHLTYIAPDISLMRASLAISEKMTLSVYDASYVALAQQMRCSLATADKKLFRNAKDFIEMTFV